MKPDKLITHILNKSLFGSSFIIESSFDWNELLNESRIHAVFICIYNEIKDLLTDDKEKWDKIYYQIISQNIRNRNAHQKLNLILTKANIPYVVLKGMASAKYYPDPSLRVMGDVDFLVRECDVERTTIELLKNGLHRTESESNGFHIAFSDNQISWELHWASPGIPKEGNASFEVKKYLSNIIDKAEYYDGYMVPSDFHHGVVMLLHFVSHMTTTGMGLRHLCDWAVFVNAFNDKAFRDMFEIPLREIGLWEYARVLTAISIKYLGVDSKDFASGVDEETIELLMEDIIESGNFGHKDCQRINQAKLMRDDATRGITQGNMVLTLFRNLNYRSRKAIPITEKIPLLLPLGWVYIGLKHIILIFRGKRTKVKIKETIMGAEKRSNVYQRLKLFQ